MLAKNKNADTVSEKAQVTIGTIIGPGAVFNGNLTAPQTIRIDGTLNGDCICKGNLILGADGIIKGNVEAQDVSLSGKVTGDVKANGKLELFSTAKLTGDVTAKSLIVDENACFDGRCTMTTPASGSPSASGSPGASVSPNASAKSQAQRESGSDNKNERRPQ